MAWRWREKGEVGEEKLRGRREGKILERTGTMCNQWQFKLGKKNLRPNTEPEPEPEQTENSVLGL
jgi:hypothetical protein